MATVDAALHSEARDLAVESVDLLDAAELAEGVTVVVYRHNSEARVNGDRLVGVRVAVYINGIAKSSMIVRSDWVRDA